GIHNTFLLEPMGRDTAAAIALATLQIARLEGPDALVLVLPADQLVTDEAALQAAVSTAAELAATGKIATFGICPTGPETGFGYIEVIAGGSLRFIEKPDLDTAERLVNEGRSFWNSGMFCFAASTMLEQMR